MYVRLLDNSGKAVVAAQQQPLSNNHKHDIHNRVQVLHAVHVNSHTEKFGRATLLYTTVQRYVYCHCIMTKCLLVFCWRVAENIMYNLYYSEI